MARSRVYTPSSDASVPGGALLLLEDGRGPDDSLAERHHRLVKGAHHYVARKESDNADCFVAYITQPVRHHGRNYRHLSRRDLALLISQRNLGRPSKDQEYLLRAVGVRPKPVAWLDLEVDNCRVLGSGPQKEGEVDLNPHRRVVLVPDLHQLKLTDLGTNHFSPSHNSWGVAGLCHEMPLPLRMPCGLVICVCYISSFP